MFLAGGVNYSFNRVFNECCIFNLKTKQVKCINSMLDIRFSFSIAYFKEKVFAIGGRAYGNNMDAILNDCEFYDFDKKKWFNCGSLNESRCQSSSYVIKNKLFVAGGLSKCSIPLMSIEVLNQKKS